MELIFNSNESRLAFGKPKISIAVRLKNELLHLPKLIHSIQQQTIVAQCELVFLDSGSIDGSIEYLKNFADRIYTINPIDFQFGKSSNQIFSVCKGDYILLLSAHVELCEIDAIEASVKLMNEKSSLAAIYFKQKTLGNQGVDFSAYESLFLKKRFPNKSGLISAKGLKKSPPISNAAALIRYKIWHEISFPEVIASEDILWAARAMRENHSIYYLSEKSIVHNHNESPSQVYKRVRINKIAQHGNKTMPFKSLIYFLGILTALVLLKKTTLIIAYKYAKAHATAYL